MEPNKGLKQELLEAACHASRLGGAVLEAWREKFTVTEKAPADLVTEADLASQQKIFSYLQERFPEHRFLGEENLQDQTDPAQSSPYRWLIDPLDGTTNYVHGYPYYAVSIGLEYKGELLLGAVFDPNREELFSALKSAGAFCNGHPIQVSQVESLASALVVASLPVCTSDQDPPVQRFLKALPRTQNVQRTGSASLNICYVASGRIDAFWSSSLKPWDMAAGVIILAEAGGLVTQISNQPFQVDQPDILCSNGSQLHEELVTLFK